MLFDEAIVSLNYDPHTRRLTVVFDSFRKIVFYEIPATVGERLLDDASSPEEAFALHVHGKFPWTETGALTPLELTRVA